MKTKFSEDQRFVLTHMHNSCIGAIHMGIPGRWVWPEDIRNDAELASLAARMLREHQRDSAA